MSSRKSRPKCSPKTFFRQHNFHRGKSSSKIGATSAFKNCNNSSIWRTGVTVYNRSNDEMSKQIVCMGGYIYKVAGFKICSFVHKWSVRQYVVSATKDFDKMSLRQYVVSSIKQNECHFDKLSLYITFPKFYNMSWHSTSGQKFALLLSIS
jgi:hypothetical protein